LWLSSDENPANKSRIAYVAVWTHPREWDKYSSQQSAAVQLVSGRKYYIEALLKEGTGGDHLAVGWKLPNGQLEMPIPGVRLSPFADSETMARQQTETTKDKTLYSQINIYPNPLEHGNTRLTIGGYRGITETIETQVDIINMTGDIVFTGKIHCGGDCSDYLLNINKQLVPGVYLMRLKTNGVKNTQRLFVK